MPKARTVINGTARAVTSLTRLYLGVHWFTDVIGGWLFATTWLSLLTCAYLRRPGPRTEDPA
ncbi:phosphatase PAP2 family protein [Streptomyces sp. NPDC058304]|uniref:phosphatase PAP2 family protein n=1 Tax=Streptomyces sp. NPDC058304 TaxID=3346437 RepID=UPI0036EEBAB1